MDQYAEIRKAYDEKREVVAELTREIRDLEDLRERERRERDRLGKILSDPPNGQARNGIDSLYVRAEDLRPYIEEWYLEWEHDNGTPHGARKALALASGVSGRTIWRILTGGGREADRSTDFITFRIADLLMTALQRQGELGRMPVYRVEGRGGFNAERARWTPVRVD